MKTHVSTLALAALMLTTGLAVAQEKQQMPGQQERGGGKADSGNRGGEAGRSEGAGQSAPRENAAPSQDRSGSAARGQSSGSEGDRRQSQDTPAMKEPRRGAEDKAAPKTGQAPKAEPKSSPKTGEAQKAEPKSSPKTGEAQKAEPKSAPKTGEAQKAEPKNRTATDPSRKQDSSQGAGAGESGRAANTPNAPDGKNAGSMRQGDNNAGARTNARADLSVEQRDRVRTAFQQQRPARVTNVRIDVNIGQRIPRNVTLRAIPAAVLTIVPEYRSYRYVFVEDRYVIVDPATYEIVYVIDEGGAAGAAPSGTRARGATLELTSSERQIILSRIDLDRRANFSFRMALGAEVPQQVELYDFPQEVLGSVRKLDRYRYVVVERNVLVVDPSSRDIVLVLDR